jgi:hypothetical protein
VCGAGGVRHTCWNWRRCGNDADFHPRRRVRRQGPIRLFFCGNVGGGEKVAGPFGFPVVPCLSTMGGPGEDETMDVSLAGTASSLYLTARSTIVTVSELLLCSAQVGVVAETVSPGSAATMLLSSELFN